MRNHNCCFKIKHILRRCRNFVIRENVSHKMFQREKQNCHILCQSWLCKEEMLRQSFATIRKHWHFYLSGVMLFKHFCCQDVCAAKIELTDYLVRHISFWMSPDPRPDLYCRKTPIKISHFTKSLSPVINRMNLMLSEDIKIEVLVVFCCIYNVNSKESFLHRVAVHKGQFLLKHR